MNDSKYLVHRIESRNENIPDPANHVLYTPVPSNVFVHKRRRRELEVRWIKSLFCSISLLSAAQMSFKLASKLTFIFNCTMDSLQLQLTVKVEKFHICDIDSIYFYKKNDLISFHMKT